MWERDGIGRLELAASDAAKASVKIGRARGSVAPAIKSGGSAL
jgi:hypothetical protein